MSHDNNRTVATFITYPELAAPNIINAPPSAIDLSKHPRDIKEYLDKFIIGQHEAKKVLSIAAYNRTIRLWSSHTTGKPCIDKANVLLLGPTGCGKTLLIRTLAEIVGAPCIIEDATSFTENGYVGRDTIDIFEHLLSVVKSDHPQLKGEEGPQYAKRIKSIAEGGIVYIDEIDKVAQIKGTGHGVSGIGVQEDLLKLIEGTTIQLGDNKSGPTSITCPSYKLGITEIDTSNILFIVGGSFHGIEEIVQKRVANSTIGFGGKIFSKEVDKNILCQAENEDLVKFGMLPELLGRFHSHVGLTALEESDLVNILTQAENNLVSQYTKLFGYYNRELVFSSDSIVKIATLAIKSKTGARGLKRIMERSLRDLMFESPSDLEMPPILIEEEDIKE